MNRYREILSAFRKRGLGFFLLKNIKNLSAHGNLFANLSDDAKTELGVKLRLFCEDLGPAFIKVAQLLSTRVDMIPEETAEELSHLQNEVAPVDYVCVKELIETELGGSISDIFESFDECPVASGSIAQVHRAVLKDGTELALKVKRPGIDRIVEQDLSILDSIAAHMMKNPKYGRHYDLTGMVSELSVAMKKELDFIIEAHNTEKFAANMSDIAGVRCPKIFWKYTTPSIMAMEYIRGVKISDIDTIRKNGCDTAKICEAYVNALLLQILRDGFFHADPHPGNEFVTEDGTLVFIDFGMAGEISESLRHNLNLFVVGLAMKNTSLVTKAIIDMGICENHINERAFERDISRLLDQFMYSTLENVALMDVFDCVREECDKYSISIPREMTMIGKCLGNAQHIVELLDPSLSMIALAGSISGKIYRNYLKSGSIMKQLLNDVVNGYDSVHSLPVTLGRMIRKFEDDDFAIETHERDSEKNRKNRIRAANRVLAGLIILAGAVVCAGLLIALFR